LPGSPAIGGGTPVPGVITDQRGQPRFGRVDIGAFQSQGFVLTIANGNSQIAEVATAFAKQVTVAVTPNNSVEPVNGGTISLGATATGASASFPPATATISGGQAAATATANATPGQYTGTATTSGAESIFFDLTNVSLVVTITQDEVDNNYDVTS